MALKSKVQPAAPVVLSQDLVVAKPMVEAVRVQEEDNRICACIEQNASIVLIVLLIFLLDTAYLMAATNSGGMANLRRQNSIFPQAVHRWQLTLETKQIYLCKALMDLMCSSALNMIYGFLCTASFMWPVPQEVNTVSILLGNIVLQVVALVAGMRIPVMVKIVVIAAYHWNCTMSRNKFGVCLLVQAVFCGDILGQSPYVVRWIFMVFFLARVCEMAPVLTKWLRVGVCFTQVSVDFSKTTIKCMRVPLCVVNVIAKQASDLFMLVVADLVTPAINSPAENNMQPLQQKDVQNARGHSPAPRGRPPAPRGRPPAPGNSSAPGKSPAPGNSSVRGKSLGRPKKVVNPQDSGNSSGRPLPKATQQKANPAPVANAANDATSAPVANAANVIPAPVAIANDATSAPVASAINAIPAPVAMDIDAMPDQVGTKRRTARPHAARVKRPRQ